MISVIYSFCILCEVHAYFIVSLIFSPLSGLVNDIKRKIPWYGSDFKDSLHIQCLAAFVYVFLGTFTPNVTFGGLLGQATDQYMVGAHWSYYTGNLNIVTYTGVKITFSPCSNFFI